MKRLGIIILILLLAVAAQAQLENSYIRRGNRFYKRQKYPQSEAQYRLALKKNPTSFLAKNNLGLALYKENNDTGAIRILGPLLLQKSDSSYMSQAAYNLGVVMTKIAGDSLKIKDLKGSIRYLEQAKKTFRRSVKYNPQDYEARYNLWVVQHLLDSLKQQQRSRQQQNNQHNKNQQQKNKNQQQKNQQQNKQNDKQQQQRNQNQNNQQQPRQFKDFNQKEIERMLRAVEQQDKKLQQKVLKQLMNRRQHKKTDKNW